MKLSDAAIICMLVYAYQNDYAHKEWVKACVGVYGLCRVLEIIFF